VGCDGDAAAFAIATLRRWWEAEGQQCYPEATRLLITADVGGSNSYQVRAWKKEPADVVSQRDSAIRAVRRLAGMSM